METKKDKIDAFKREFDLDRKRLVLSQMVLIVACIVMVEMASFIIQRTLSRSILPTYAIYIHGILYLLMAIYLYVCMFRFGRAIKEENIERRLREKEDDLRVKRAQYAKIVAAYPYWKDNNYVDMPGNMYKELIELVNLNSDPDKIVRLWSQNIEDVEVEIMVYKSASPTYWSYLFSLQWLKKIH